MHAAFVLRSSFTCINHSVCICLVYLSARGPAYGPTPRWLVYGPTPKGPAYEPTPRDCQGAITYLNLALNVRTADQVFGLEKYQYQLPIVQICKQRQNCILITNKLSHLALVTA